MSPGLVVKETSGYMTVGVRLIAKKPQDLQFTSYIFQENAKMVLRKPSQHCSQTQISH